LKKINLRILIPFLLFLILGYVSTGTLSPFANTLDFEGFPFVEPKCQYLYNGDYPHFYSLFLMLDGQPSFFWDFSIYTRRILYNVIAFPFMKKWGHDSGGIICNFLLMIVSGIFLFKYSWKRYNQRTAEIVLWLYMGFTGIFYFIGQPFLHNIIVPSCLLIYVLLEKITGEKDFVRFTFYSLCLGLIHLGYDLFVFSIPAGFFLLWFSDKKRIPFFIFMSLLPLTIWIFTVKYLLGVSALNSNNEVYLEIIKAYFVWDNYSNYYKVLFDLPMLFVHNFLFSSFFVIPFFFLVVLIYYRKKTLVFFENRDWALLSALLLLFLFNNMVPYYESKWQMRGYWIARIYEPLFLPLLFIMARLISSLLETGFSKFILISMILFQIAIPLLPLIYDPLHIASKIYYNYYRHSPEESMVKNLKKHGIRPFGFCKSNE
jgi:hypothetical protein